MPPVYAAPSSVAAAAPSGFPSTPRVQMLAASTSRTTSAASDAGPTALAGRPLACSICYEGVKPGATLDEVTRQGAALVVNLANDGWFDPASEPALHLASVRLRAVEAGRPWVRASNRGISAFFSASGRSLTEASGPPTRAVVSRLPLAPAPTLFSRLGPLGAWSGLLLVLGALRGRSTTPL